MTNPRRDIRHARVIPQCVGSDLRLGRNKRVATFFVDMQNNMLVASKRNYVVQPLLAQGWDVDVSVELVALGIEPGFTWTPIDGTAAAEGVSALSSRMAGEVL